MRRILLLSAMASLLGGTESAQAQIFVRAPFVRVQVGGPGVYVRAPFVHLWFPGGPPPYYVGPGTIVVPPPPPVIVPPPAPVQPFPPQPVPVQPPAPPVVENPDQAPPAPNQSARALTAQEFAKSFQAKPGSYEVTLMNPVTGRPTSVQFTLPEGTPRRVLVHRREIEFDYGPRKYVRIQFDQDGAQVVSR